MAKGSGGTGGGKGGGTSRGQQLRDKFGNQETAINNKFPERNRFGDQAPAALRRTLKSEGVRAAIKSNRRSPEDVEAAIKSKARNDRKLGKAPKGGDEATRRGAQRKAQQRIRNENAAFDRAISGRGNVKVKRSKNRRVSPATASRIGGERNII